MAYFLKKTNRKNDVYLQIYESRHDPVKKYAVHSSVEVIGYVKELIANGITDPYVYAQNKVDNLNREFHKAQQAKKTQKIGSTPLRNVGYFMLAQLYEKLNLSKDIQILSSGPPVSVFDGRAASGFDLCQIYRSLLQEEIHGGRIPIFLQAGTILQRSNIRCIGFSWE